MGVEGLDDAGGQGRWEWEGERHDRGELGLLRGDKEAKQVENCVDD